MKLTLLVCLLLSLAPARGDSVHVQSTPGVPFSSLKQYTWRTHPIYEKKPQLAEEYSVGIELVKNAVNQNLMGRGYQSTRLSPDFYITFVLTGQAKQDIDVEYVDGFYGWGGWYGWPSMYYPTWTQTVVTNYIEGTLVLDFVDSKSNQLIWRAYCKGDVKDWKNRHKDVEKAVNKALKKFPPKS